MKIILSHCYHNMNKIMTRFAEYINKTHATNYRSLALRFYKSESGGH